MSERIPKSSSSDEYHPEVSKTESSSIHDHPHQRHEIDCEGSLPGNTHNNHKNKNLRWKIVIKCE